MAFTACVRKRLVVFTEATIVEEMTTIMFESASWHHSHIIVYVFMPDHLHVIIASDDERGDPLAAMKRFKQRSSYWLARHHKGIRWQKDFYDRIVRTPRELDEHVRYILNNPVRSGMADSWKEYPFIGSEIWDLKSWIE